MSKVKELSIETKKDNDVMKKKIDEFEFMLFKSDKNAMMESKVYHNSFSLQKTDDQASVRGQEERDENNSRDSS
jgi:hypothetical protein